MAKAKAKAFFAFAMLRRGSDGFENLIRDIWRIYPRASFVPTKRSRSARVLGNYLLTTIQRNLWYSCSALRHGFSQKISNTDSLAESKMSESGKTATETFSVKVRLDPEAIQVNGKYQVQWLPRFAVTTSSGTSHEGGASYVSAFFTKVAADNLDLIGKEEHDSFLNEWQNPARTKTSLEAPTCALRRRFMSFLKANGNEIHEAISKAATGPLESSYKVEGYRTDANVDVTGDPDWIDVGDEEELQIRIEVPLSVILGS